MPINGAFLNNSGELRISGSAESGGSTSTTSLLNCAHGGAPYAESNIPSGKKTDCSLTTFSVTISGFTENGSNDGSAPHGMQESRGAGNQADDGPGGGR